MNNKTAVVESKLSSEEKLKIFAAYFGSEVQFIFQTRSDNPELKNELRVGKMARLGNNGASVRIDIFTPNGNWHDINIDDCKLLLTPVSDISDEHAIEVMQIEYGYILNGYETLRIERNDKGRVHINFRWVHTERRRNLDDGYSYSSWATNFSHISKEVFQYLISKGYVVPLFFGINHWANGKTAIELDIAINKNQTHLNQ